MITREEALRRLDAVAHELVALRAALAEGWTETPSENPTQAFLAKCGGWEDTRSPEEIIAEMLSSWSAADLHDLATHLERVVRDFAGPPESARGGESFPARAVI